MLIRQSFYAHVVQALIGVAIPLHAILTLQTEYTRLPFSRDMAPIIVAIEMIIIAICYLSGFRLTTSISSIPPWIRYALSAWIISAWTSSFFSINFTIAIFHSVITTITAVLALALWERLSNEWTQFREGIARAASAGLVAYFAIALLAGSFIISPSDYPFKNFGVGVSNVRQIGFYGVVLVGFSMALLSLRQSKSGQFLIVGFLLIGWILTLWSGGRGALLSGVVASTSVILCSLSSKRASLFAVATLTFVLAIPFSHVLALSELWGVNAIFFGNDFSSLNKASSNRIAMWIHALELWCVQPWFGYGEAQYRLISDHSGFNHPHNSLLQSLIQWGLIGTLPLLFAATSLMRLGWRSIGSGSQSLFGIGVVSGLLAHSLVEGSLFHIGPRMLLSLALALFLVNSGPKSPEPSSQDQ